MRNFLLSQNALRLFILELATILQQEGISPRVVEQEHPKVLDALEIIDSALSLPGFSPKNASDIANELKGARKGVKRRI